jgi:predicted ATP-binding protein involved in virulence
VYDPLTNALEFVKNYENDDYSINQWLANTISKRSFARDEGSYEKADLINRNIKNLEQIIEQIIEMPIKFEPVYETGIKIVATVNGKKLDFDLLPDGLRSIISWLGDLIMRMDALKWKDDLPLFEREFILFLDEIEVHLHPYWQRKILPVVQKLFKNAQIFITTHSPFIVNSIDGAFIYELKLDDKGNCHCEKPQISSTAQPIDEVLEEIYEISPTQMYGKNSESEINGFREDIEKAYQRSKDFDKTKFLKKAKKLALKSEELKDNVQFELRQLSNSLEEEFKI